MRKMVWLSGLILALATPALAQDETPKVEASAGYSYVRVNVDTTAAGGTGTQGFNGNGGSGSIAFNMNRWFGVVADFGGYTHSETITVGGTTVTGTATAYSYLFGPKIASRGHEKWTPFAQALFGGVHGNASGSTGGVSLGSTSENVFGMAIGGGLDYNVSKHVGIRVIQAEYLLTKFTDGVNNRQNNVRLTFGIVFRTGS
jgi:opacity protein-like surface antigen